MSSARWGFKYLDYIEGLAGGVNVAAMSAAGRKTSGRAEAAGGGSAAGDTAGGYAAAAGAAAEKVKEADIRADSAADTLRENTAAAGLDETGSGKTGPDKKNPRTGVSASAGEAFKLDLSDRSLLNGIVLAEILGKPKCFKRGRW